MHDVLLHWTIYACSRTINMTHNFVIIGLYIHKHTHSTLITLQLKTTGRRYWVGGGSNFKTV